MDQTDSRPNGVPLHVHSRVWVRNGRSRASGATRWPQDARHPPTWSSTATTGTRSAGRRRPTGWRAWPTACSRVACARETRSGSSPARRSSGRSSTSPSRTSGPSARRSTRTARRATSPTSSSTRKRSASSARTSEQRAKVEAERARCRTSAHALTYDGSPCARGRGRRARPAASGRARRRGHGDRRGRSLHVHLHVGHDRPAEGAA